MVRQAVLALVVTGVLSTPFWAAAQVTSSSSAASPSVVGYGSGEAGVGQYPYPYNLAPNFATPGEPSTNGSGGGHAGPHAMNSRGNCGGGNCGGARCGGPGPRPTTAAPARGNGTAGSIGTNTIMDFSQ